MRFYFRAGGQSGSILRTSQPLIYSLICALLGRESVCLSVVWIGEKSMRFTDKLASRFLTLRRTFGIQAAAT